MRDALRRALAHAPDFLRALARLSLDRGGPRDLAAIRDGLAAAAALASIARGRSTISRPSSSALTRGCAPTAARSSAIFNRRSPTICRFSSATADSCARTRCRRSTRRGALRDESRRVIAEMQASYAEQAGVRQLKIKHNNFLGYYIETPQAAGETLIKAPLNATFIHRQTMAGAMRFTTNALVDLEARIASAADRALAARTRSVRAPAPGLPRRGRNACAASARRWPRSTSPPRSPNSLSSAIGPGRLVDASLELQASRAGAIRWSKRR